VRRPVALLMIALVFAAGVFGQVPTQSPVTNKDAAPVPESASGRAHEMTAADVESFLDGLLPLQIKRDDIAGATVAVVKDGKLLFAKGYGYADVEKKKPVSAQDTLFRPGSVSKLFTWTAIMQLFEQGKLNLDADVNQYLDYQIPEAFGKPVTLRNLMTHTAGFEELLHGLMHSDPESYKNLETYVHETTPVRMFPPVRLGSARRASA